LKKVWDTKDQVTNEGPRRRNALSAGVHDFNHGQTLAERLTTTERAVENREVRQSDTETYYTTPRTETGEEIKQEEAENQTDAPEKEAVDSEG